MRVQQQANDNESLRPPRCFPSFKIANGLSLRITHLPLACQLNGFSCKAASQRKGKIAYIPLGLDLHALNMYLKRYKLRMLTHAALICLVRPGDRFTTSNLREAYFHIPIYPPHRKYVRISGHILAVAPFWERGICLPIYIDDSLLLAQSEWVGRFYGEQGQECVNIEARNNFSWPELPHLHGSPVSGESGYNQVHSGVLCHIKTGHVRFVSQTVGSGGFRAVGSEVGQVVHEVFSIG